MIVVNNRLILALVIYKYVTKADKVAACPDGYPLKLNGWILIKYKKTLINKQIIGANKTIINFIYNLAKYFMYVNTL